MVTLPGMRPNLLPNAEKAKPCFGSVSAVSSVKSPSVPVVASMGVNFGAGLYSLLVSFFSLAGICGEAAVSSDGGCGAGAAVASSEFVEVASSDEFLVSLPASEFLENAGVI